MGWTTHVFVVLMLVASAWLIGEVLRFRHRPLTPRDRVRCALALACWEGAIAGLLASMGAWPTAVSVAVAGAVSVVIVRAPWEDHRR